MSNNVKIIVYKSQRQGRKISFKKFHHSTVKKKERSFFVREFFGNWLYIFRFKFSFQKLFPDNSNVISTRFSKLTKEWCSTGARSSISHADAFKGRILFCKRWLRFDGQNFFLNLLPDFLIAMHLLIHIEQSDRLDCITARGSGSKY